MRTNTPTPGAALGGQAADTGRGDALRDTARGRSFGAGEAILSPPGQAAPAAAPRAAAPEAALGLTRGTAPDEALRSRVMADYRRGNDLLGAGQYHGAIAVHSSLYALPNLSMTVRFKLAYELGMGHAALGNHETALSFLREAQGLPDVPGNLRASGTDAMAMIHQDAARGRGAPTTMSATGSAREAMRATHQEASAAFEAGQYAAAYPIFMRAYLDQRAVGRLPDARAAAIMNAGVCKIQLGQAAEGLRHVQDGLAIAGIGSQTRLGGFDIMREAHLAIAQREAGSGRAATTGDARRLFDDSVAAIRGNDWARGLELLMQIYTGPAWARIDPDSRGAFVYNIAACHKHLGHRAEALDWFQNALGRHGFHNRGSTADAIRSLRVEDARGASQPIAPAPMQAPSAGGDTQVAASAQPARGEPRVTMVPPSFDEAAPEAAPAAPSGQGATRVTLEITPDDFAPRGG
ncbi:MAG: hypothetical protein IT385_26885 [Deltaproteobacteria bacterium]|nr:hypothetical protein [Deltaproteobacteria bacterium]